MNVYHLERADFEEIEAGQLQEGDFLALPDPSDYQCNRYGAIRVDDLTSGEGWIVVTMCLPVGVKMRSDDLRLELHVEWEGSHPVITIHQMFQEKEHILRRKADRSA